MTGQQQSQARVSKVKVPLARLLVRAAVHAAHVARVVEVWLPDAAIVRAMPARHIHHACLLTVFIMASPVEVVLIAPCSSPLISAVDTSAR